VTRRAMSARPYGEVESDKYATKNVPGIKIARKLSVDGQPLRD